LHSRYSGWLRDGPPKGRNWSPSRGKIFLIPMSSRLVLKSSEPPIPYVRAKNSRCVNLSTRLKLMPSYLKKSSNAHTCSNSEVREIIAVKVLHISLLNITLVAFKVFPLGSYEPMPAPSLPFKTILELVL
jgi:hypothetical protein